MNNKNIKTINFREFQEKSIKLLEIAIEILNKHEVVSWAVAGTLLGIIRHDGKMIPWDDDIDIVIRLGQWQLKREEIIKDFEKRNLVIIDYYNDNFDFVPFIKYLKIFEKNKYNIVYEGKTHNANASPFIDIFFTTNEGNWSEKRWKFYSKLVNIKWIWAKGFKRFELNLNNKTLTFLANLGSYPLKLFPLRNKIDKFINEMEKDDLTDPISRRVDVFSYQNRVYNDNNLIDANFENVKVKINADYQEELILSYGPDWMIEKKVDPHFQHRRTMPQNIYNSTCVQIQMEKNELNK